MRWWWELRNELLVPWWVPLGWLALIVGGCVLFVLALVVPAPVYRWCADGFGVCGCAFVVSYLVVMMRRGLL